jgi:hypothetical protein
MASIFGVYGKDKITKKRGRVASVAFANKAAAEGFLKTTRKNFALNYTDLKVETIKKKTDGKDKKN